MNNENLQQEIEKLKAEVEKLKKESEERKQELLLEKIREGKITSQTVWGMF